MSETNEAPIQGNPVQPQHSVINSETVVFNDTDGSILFTAKLSDLYFFVGNVLPEFQDIEYNNIPGGKQIGVFKAFAEVFNKEFGCNLSWSQVWNVTMKLDEIIENVKKNGEGSTRGLPIATDSAPSVSPLTS